MHDKQAEEDHEEVEEDGEKDEEEQDTLFEVPPGVVYLLLWMLTCQLVILFLNLYMSTCVVLDDYRSSLKPEMVEALVCGASYIKGSHKDFNVVV